MMTLTKFQLSSLQFSPTTPWMKLADGRYGILQSVLREDGSGRSFVVTVSVPRQTPHNQQQAQLNETQSFHVRTID